MSDSSRERNDEPQPLSLTRHVCRWGVDCTNWHAIEALRKQLDKMGYGRKKP